MDWATFFPSFFRPPEWIAREREAALGPAVYIGFVRSTHRTLRTQQSYSYTRAVLRLHTSRPPGKYEVPGTYRETFRARSIGQFFRKILRSMCFQYECVCIWFLCCGLCDFKLCYRLPGACFIVFSPEHLVVGSVVVSAVFEGLALPSCLGSLRPPLRTRFSWLSR